jgi:hypothetical protein
MLPGHTPNTDPPGVVDGIQIERATTFSFGDGIAFDHAHASGFVIRSVHIKYSRDDCIEDDVLYGGTIDSVFLDGCYSGVSARKCDTCSANGTDNIITMSNSLVRLQSMDIVYKTVNGGDGDKVGPEHNAFWKWGPQAPKLRLYHNVFRADGGKGGNDPQEYMAPPNLDDCQDNILIWLSNAAAPTMPACFTVVTIAQGGLQQWNDSVAHWWGRHPHSNSLPDHTPPIVSLFSPGPPGWVTGTPAFVGNVTLVATAVDDSAMKSVQFQLTPPGGSAQNIGVPVTQDGAYGDIVGPTKYRLVSWDSYNVLNGPYTLAALAQDSAGLQQTSAGIAVTVNNPPLASPTNCQMVRQGPPPPAQTVYLKVTWTNGSPAAPTEVTIVRGGIPVRTETVSAGLTSYFYPPNGVGGQYWAYVRHVRGVASSGSCTTNSVTIDN